MASVGTSRGHSLEKGPARCVRVARNPLDALPRTFGYLRVRCGGVYARRWSSAQLLGVRVVGPELGWVVHLLVFPHGKDCRREASSQGDLRDGWFQSTRD